MENQTCSALACHQPLRNVLEWSPFRIDALGIITMIGSDQVESAVGRLVNSRYVEYLPLLGAFAIASDQFADARSGYALYNITDGITTTDLAGWFVRWCSAQKFAKSDSTVRWSVDTRPWSLERYWRDRLTATLICIVTNGFLVALTILQGDWWGFANALSMVVSVLVRAHVLEQNRTALDLAARKGFDMSNGTESKFLVVLSDSRMIAMHAPSGLVQACFVQKPQPQDPRLYYTVRMIGWASFAVQAVSLGMSGLATQIITVLLMVSATVLMHFQVGCDDTIIGRRLKAQQHERGGTRRQDLYVSLQLEEHEEESMLRWNLMPHKTPVPASERWWREYYEKKKEFGDREKNLEKKVSVSVVVDPCGSV
ncbi:hypothetical protein GJ744_010645 [Endocarpon pusillum]|uniref:Uncharacterized protein n=1 Tax=Endocarpon pusillum TaxID=364733 RepID=A0A8H7E7G1_9EURO|nr:hypothetical protein GJ744_010645 [Endocarpon pusillum]